MNWNCVKKVVFGFAVGFAAAGASVGWANPVQWRATFDPYFTAWTDNNGGVNGVTGSLPVGGSGTDYRRLSWGSSTGGGQSTLTSGAYDGSTFGVDQLTFGLTFGAFSNVVQLVHDNNSITAGNGTLSSATLTSPLVLEWFDGTNWNSVGALTPQTFNIRFTETPNVQSCGFPSTSNCDDVFILVNPQALIFPFDLGSVHYVLQFQSTGALQSLPASVCSQVPGWGDNPCTGWETREDFANTMLVQARIDYFENVVPEPGLLSLIGLGLAGLAAVRRRKH